jgi:D-arabinose 1-dehydrogenase-like Zn-dependent alcohol dehydrogenase
MTQVISLDEVDQAAKNMLENKTFGRIVVDVNL